MKRPFTSTGVVNTLSFVRDAVLSSSGDGGHLLKVGSWKDVLRLTHSVGLTLLGAGTIGALLLLRQVSPGAALSWILQARPPHGSPDPSSIDPSHLTVPGLRNIGNNCFLNAILQALASSGVLLSFLAAYDRESILSLFHGVESRCASLPLTEALSDLLVELSELDSEPRVMTPRHVMRALEPYAKQFDLSLQQDAAEALTYLTSALHEERLAFFESFRAYRESISDASRTCLNGGFLTGTVIDNTCGKERSPFLSWKHQLRWPMEGTIASMLTCKQCGFQFSTQFQSFHDVPLSPPQLPDGNIVSRCNLEACLEQFTSPECITNVKCSYCSHSLALRLLQIRDGLDKLQALLQSVKDCTFDDDCSCEKLVTQAGGVWRNVYVNAVKQLRFGRCPEVLCCQVQRAVVNKSGELVKWTGHVSFPIVLNLSPYVMSTQGYSSEMCISVGKYSAASMGQTDVLQKYLWPKRSLDMQSNPEFDNNGVPSSTDGSSSDDTVVSGSEDLASDTSSESFTGRLGDDIVCKQHEGAELSGCHGCISLTSGRDLKMYGLDSAVLSSLGQNFLPLDDREKFLFRFQEPGDGASFLEPCSQMAHSTFPSFSMSQRYSTMMPSGSAQRSNTVLNKAREGGLYNSGRWLYELISVVVHHGSPRNGHYTVYRKAKLKVDSSAELENKSTMLEDELTDSDGCKSEAMAIDDWKAEGCDEEMNCTADSSESLSANISNDSKCTTRIGSRDENKDIIPAESLPRPTEDLVRREGHCIDSSALPSLECDTNSEAKEGACMDAASRNPKAKQTNQEEEEIVLWFRVSDSHVDVVTEEEVMMAQATLLFYERPI